MGGARNEVFGSRKGVSCGTPKLMECRIKNLYWLLAADKNIYTVGRLTSEKRKV